MNPSTNIIAKVFGGLNAVIINECQTRITLSVCSEGITSTIVGSILSILDNEGKHNSCACIGGVCDTCTVRETSTRFYEKSPKESMSKTLSAIPVETRGLYEVFLAKQRIALALYTPEDYNMFRVDYEQKSLPKVCEKRVDALSVYRQVMFRVVDKSICEGLERDVEILLDGWR